MTDRKPLFKHEQIIKLSRLLDMMYKPTEIAKEINVSVDTVYRSYLPAGAPHTRDKSGAIWIHGLSFSEWVRSQPKTRPIKGKRSLKINEAWCMRCNKPVEIQNPKRKKVNIHISMIKGICPNCGTKINRIISNKEMKK